MRRRDFLSLLLTSSLPLPLFMGVAGASNLSGGSKEDRIALWENFVLSLDPDNAAYEISAISSFCNRLLRYQEDATAWEKNDFWATPHESLALGRGDCDDIALLKFCAMRLSGFSPSRTRLVYGHLSLPLEKRTTPHLMTGYYAQKDDPQLLDNTTSMVFPLSQRPDFLPGFSFNMTATWLHDPSCPQRAPEHFAGWRRVKDILSKNYGIH